MYFDFDVPVGTNYELGILGTNAGLYRNNGGVNYPYNIGGLVSITSSLMLYQIIIPMDSFIISSDLSYNLNINQTSSNTTCDG